MPKAKPERPARLSELEGAVLGLIWRAGPITAHLIRKTFLASPTDHFSGSAGAIYPLVRRLAAANLIEPSATAEGVKGGTAYALTAEGRRALKSWIAPADASTLVSVTFDPLRTRVLMLGLLGKRERARFLAEAEQELERRVNEETIALKNACQDRWVEAACDGALAVMRARLRWIRATRRASV